MPRGPYRAVSFDLWYTTVFHTAEESRGWEEERLRVLRQVLRRADGPEPSSEEVRRAMETLERRFRSEGRNPGLTDPGVVLAGYAEILGARVLGDPEEAAEEFSSAGFARYPPSLNPEAPAVLRSLRDRNVRVISITNTARRESTWKRLLNGRYDLGFLHIVTSCGVGRAKPDPAPFLEAARRLALPPEEILHVGDRWELDVEGARRAGYGAVLYRGLWGRYPEGEYSATDPALLTEPSVRCIDRLDELLDGRIELAGR